MRICIFGDTTSIHIQRWCGFFVGRGHDVHLVDFVNDNEVPGIKGVNIHTVHTKMYAGSTSKFFHDAVNIVTGNRYKYSQITSSIRRIIQEIKPDIVHGHYLTKHGYWAARSGFRPLVLTTWGSDIADPSMGQKEKKFIKYALENSDMVHTGDISGKERLVQLGCTAKNIFIQAWGVNIEQFTPTARSDELRTELLGRPDGKIVTIVYALEDQYNVVEFVKAAAIVRKKDDKVSFLVIGEGSERKTLEALSSYLNANVIFRGRIPNLEIQKYLSSSDIYVDTYYSNLGGGGIGVAVMEAMACGLPIIAARRPGIEMGVQDGENGFLYTTGDPKELASRILLLVSDNEEHSGFGARSRENAEKLGNWNRNMEEFECLYIELSSK